MQIVILHKCKANVHDKIQLLSTQEYGAFEPETCAAVGDVNFYNTHVHNIK